MILWEEKNHVNGRRHVKSQNRIIRHNDDKRIDNKVTEI